MINYEQIVLPLSQPFLRGKLVTLREQGGSKWVCVSGGVYV